MIDTLDMRLFHLATHDGPQTQLPELLRRHVSHFCWCTHRRPQWRLPKDQEDDPRDADEAIGRVVIVIPHNDREAPPADAGVDEPPLIEAEPVPPAESERP
jgi:hypothetical protein